MENFKELNKLIYELEEIESNIRTIKNVDKDTFLYLYNGNINAFGNIEHVLGDEKFKNIISQFTTLINEELYKLKEEKEKELSLYRITKIDN